MAMNICISTDLIIHHHQLDQDETTEVGQDHPVTIAGSNPVTFHADHQIRGQTARREKRFTMLPDLLPNMPLKWLGQNGRDRAARIRHREGIEALVPFDELLPQQLPLRR